MPAGLVVTPSTMAMFMHHGTDVVWYRMLLARLTPTPNLAHPAAGCVSTARERLISVPTCTMGPWPAAPSPHHPPAQSPRHLQHSGYPQPAGTVVHQQNQQLQEWQHAFNAGDSRHAALAVPHDPGQGSSADM
jgi:hypothetical protein